MKILLLGCKGQVGWELQRSLAVLGNVVALDRQGFDGMPGDLNDPAALCNTVKQAMPDVIVNAAAYTAVDKAEAEPELAAAINAKAPEMLALQAKAIGACLVHYSTDYVFDGSKSSPWKEDDLARPLNIYGKTKFEGEDAIRMSGCRYLIFRTSWVYAARGGNFIHAILNLASERDSLKVIDDQAGAPTGADLIADITAHALRLAQKNGKGLSSTYHLAPAGETSWWEYACLVVEAASRAGMKLKVGGDGIEPVPSEAFHTAAVRPRNSRLDTSRLQEVFGLYLPRWEDGVLRAVNEIATSAQYTNNATH